MQSVTLLIHLSSSVRPLGLVHKPTHLSPFFLAPVSPFAVSLALTLTSGPDKIKSKKLRRCWSLGREKRWDYLVNQVHNSLNFWIEDFSPLSITYSEFQEHIRKQIPRTFLCWRAELDIDWSRLWRKLDGTMFPWKCTLSKAFSHV